MCEASKARSDLEAMSEVPNDGAENCLQSVIDLCQHPLALAIDDRLCRVTYSALGTSLYALDLTQNQPAKEGVRNMEFEVVFPFYSSVSEIIEKRKTPKTTTIQIEASSREHWHAQYTSYFVLNQWSYTKMDEIISALADQLTMKENLNRGLMMNISLY